MTGLKPCPFCGGIAVSKALYGGEYIECGTCGCSTKRFIKMDYAIKVWNKRVNTEAEEASE